MSQDTALPEPAPAQPPARGPAPTGLRRITGPVSIGILAVAVIGVASALPGESPAVIGAAGAALLVAVAGTTAIFFWPYQTAGPDTAALLAVGLAGVALVGLLPNTPGFAIVYLALAGLGIRLPPRPALAAALVIFAAMNAAIVLAGLVSFPALASQDIGAAFLFAIGAFTRSALVAQDQARAAQARAEGLLVQLRASQAAQAQAAAIAERARLAREIHDVLAHTMAGLVLALDTMELLGRPEETGPETPERMLEQVTRCQRIARDGLADSKRAIAALRGDALPGPALLARLVRDTATATGIRAGLSVTGSQRPLPPELGLAIYRTAQEALTNTARHAGRGASAELRLTYGADTVELVAEDARRDDAVPGTAGLTFGGYGLTGMRERAELLGGSLTAGPTETGFQVRLRLPDGRAASPQPETTNGPQR